MNYPDDFINKIICGDCLEVMKQIPDKRVDLVLTDPPYNVNKDYGVYKDNRSPEEYQNWMHEIVKQLERTSQKGIVFYVDGKLTKLFFDLIPTAHLIIVHKRAIGVMAGNYFLQYHSLFSTVKPIKKTKDLWDDVRLPGEGYFFREQRHNTPGLTSQKLTEKIVDAFSNPADTILDPFMGSGTTAVACKQLKRNFIGIEISPEYCKIAEQRLRQEVLL